jgi:hypothetical protein
MDNRIIIKELKQVLINKFGKEINDEDRDSLINYRLQQAATKTSI